MKLNSFTQLSKVRVIGIFGSIRTGKTALAYNLIDKFKGHKPIFFLNHPNVELVNSLGYQNLTGIEEFGKLQDCVVYWDEPQLSLGNVKEYMKSEILAKICSLAGQRGITLILSTSDTRTFTTRLEAYIELWLIKDMDYSMTKQRSMIRNVIKSNCLFMPEEFSLNCDQFLSYSRILKNFNGRHSFNLVDCWNSKMSTPYREENK